MLFIEWSNLFFLYFVYYVDKYDEIIYSMYIYDKSCKLLVNFL